MQFKDRDFEALSTILRAVYKSNANAKIKQITNFRQTQKTKNEAFVFGDMKRIMNMNNKNFKEHIQKLNSKDLNSLRDAMINMKTKKIPYITNQNTLFNMNTKISTKQRQLRSHIQQKQTGKPIKGNN